MSPAKLNEGTKSAIDEMPTELLAGIGEVVARWGYLHFQLGVIVREIAGIKDKALGRVITLGPELSAVCGQLRVLTMTDRWLKDETLRKDIQELAEDARDSSKHRNNYAHGIYAKSDSGGFVRILLQEAAHRIRPGEEAITVDLLKRHAKEAANLWVRAQVITDRLKGRSK